jgi:prepilin signal peptidase PulO-like enzyme (type II secretory pathway)
MVAVAVAAVTALVLVVPGVLVTSVVMPVLPVERYLEEAEGTPVLVAVSLEQMALPVEQTLPLAVLPLVVASLMRVAEQAAQQFLVTAISLTCQQELDMEQSVKEIK